MINHSYVLYIQLFDKEMLSFSTIIILYIALQICMYSYVAIQMVTAKDVAMASKNNLAKSGIVFATIYVAS